MARAQHRQKHAQIRIVRTESHCFLYIGNSRFRLAAELRRSLIGAGAVALGGMVLWGLQKASAGINFDAVVAGIRATSPTALLGSFAATYLSFIALLGYDLSGLRYAGARSPFTAALLASFCGFAIGNTVGLGAFSGGAVRYRLYSAAGLSPGQIARVIFFIAIAYGIGLATITGTMRDATARFEELRALRRQLALHSAADRTDSDNSRS